MPLTIYEREDKYDITVLNTDDFKDDEYIVIRDTRPLHFVRNICNHEQIYKSISTLLRRTHMSKCAECKEDEFIEKYREKCKLEINKEDSIITCLDCDRFYNRESHLITADINKFKCYCKTARNEEMRFYDILIKEYPEVFRSYRKYDVKKNYSSDFYIIKDGKEIIIHLDDKSHKNKTNQKNDKLKLQICLQKDNIINVYIYEDYFFKNEETALEKLEDILRTLDEKIYYICDKDDTFYDYLI